MNRWPLPEDARAALRNGTGAGVKIAILDSGIESSHPAFAQTEFGDDLNFTTKDSPSSNLGQDSYGHGTAVAAAVLQIAPAAHLGSFRVLDGRIRGRENLIHEAALEAIHRGYHILHCSFGSLHSPFTIMPYKEWLDEAYTCGVHVVAACHGQNHRLAVLPAHFTNVIPVDSVSSDKADVLYKRAGNLVEFCAKGREKTLLPWTGGTEKMVEGTSFSAPLVTGLLARLLSAYPHLPPDLAKSLLREIADPLPA